MLGEDLRYLFGAFLTVFQVYRNDAEARIRAVSEGKPNALAGSSKATRPDVAAGVGIVAVGAAALFARSTAS